MTRTGTIDQTISAGVERLKDWEGLILRAKREDRPVAAVSFSIEFMETTYRILEKIRKANLYAPD